jgi:hypothetical protein
MHLRLHALPGSLRAGLALLAFLPGCRSGSDLAGAGIVLPAMDGWQVAPRTRFPAPGKPLAAWTGPAGASLVLYRTLPTPGATPEGLVEELANRLTNLPGMTVLEHRVTRLGDQSAAYVEATAPGTGDMLAATGVGTPYAPEGRPLIPTRRVAVGVPRKSDTLWLVWHYPDANHPRQASQIEAVLKEIKIQSQALNSSSY